MKPFLISCVIFLTVTALVVWNIFYIRDIAAELLYHSHRLPECDADNIDILGADDNFNSLCEIWESQRYLICLTVSHDETDAVDELLIDLDASYKNGDVSAYERARLMLIEVLQRLRHSESVSLEGIL